jgi:hypothetical protein
MKTENMADIYKRCIKQLDEMEKAGKHISTHNAHEIYASYLRNGKLK